MKYCSLLFLSIILGASLYSQESKALTMQEYIEQVKGENAGYDAAAQKSDAYQLIQKKAKLVTAPNFFASAETGYNEQVTALPFFRYNRISTQSYTAGIEQNSAYGLNTRFTFAMNKVAYNGLATDSELAVRNFQTRPVLEVTVPLLQGRFGSLARANRDLIEQQNEAQKYLAKSVAISTLIEAEQVYWKLVAAVKIVEIQHSAALQAQKIYDYVKKKEKMNLGETADVLQARALVETRKLELRQAQNDLRYASRVFNRYRYVDSDIVNEELQSIDFAKINSSVISKLKPNSRPDVKAARASMQVAMASAKIEEENAKPSLNLYGAYAFKGVQYGATDGINNAFTARGKEGLVGVKFSVPFYIGTILDVQKGAKMSATAAKNEYRQKAFDEDNDWQELMAQIVYYQERADLARKIETAQKSKLENERKLLKQGRTSTYQILLFEQEYSQSQLNSISSAAQFFVLMAQRKLYDL